MIVFSAAHAGQIEPFFASLANPTLMSRDSIMYPAVIMILRFVGSSMRMIHLTWGLTEILLVTIYLPIA